MTDEELRERFPGIVWEMPLKITVVSPQTGKPVVSYFCRYCIAHNGVAGREVLSKQLSYGDVIAHLDQEHPTGGG